MSVKYLVYGRETVLLVLGILSGQNLFAYGITVVVNMSIVKCIQHKQKRMYFMNVKLLRSTWYLIH